MKNLIYLLTFVFFASCAEKDIFENKKVYYKFNGSDFDNIPTKYSQIGKVSIYKDASGESIEIKNDSYSIDENVYLNGELFGTVYYNDRLFIRLKFTSKLTHNDFDIDITKYEINKMNYNIGTQNLKENDGVGQSFGVKFPKENNLLTDKVINKVSYNKIRIFELAKDAFLNISPTVKINKIYFDLKGGVIGLEDSANNNQFWISN